MNRDFFCPCCVHSPFQHQAIQQQYPVLKYRFAVVTGKIVFIHFHYPKARPLIDRKCMKACTSRTNSYCFFPVFFQNTGNQSGSKSPAPECRKHGQIMDFYGGILGILCCGGSGIQRASAGSGIPGACGGSGIQRVCGIPGKQRSWPPIQNQGYRIICICEEGQGPTMRYIPGYRLFRWICHQKQGSKCLGAQI